MTRWCGVHQGNVADTEAQIVGATETGSGPGRPSYACLDCIRRHNAGDNAGDTDGTTIAPDQRLLLRFYPVDPETQQRTATAPLLTMALTADRDPPASSGRPDAGTGPDPAVAADAEPEPEPEDFAVAAAEPVDPAVAAAQRAFAAHLRGCDTCHSTGHYRCPDASGLRQAYVGEITRARGKFVGWRVT
ncbi:hypothetical protein [Actinacidiphila sp. ITFR-21]|uniref:hypothetical protein n=1 Tax=Actinacidiphila sp. ITFR-21 TaxID=3075199 RepID=UPI00288BA8A5|nr:hypothetical protein [Streptomyces sp. ITFR-21]WNI16599.1 hypothetical protein RLT57_14495 [Streptomyces sp. ITFR-21]